MSSTASLVPKLAVSSSGSKSVERPFQMLEPMPMLPKGGIVSKTDHGLDKNRLSDRLRDSRERGEGVILAPRSEKTEKSKQTTKSPEEKLKSSRNLLEFN